MTYKCSKLGRNDLVFGLWSPSLGVHTQNYKYLSAALEKHVPGMTELRIPVCHLTS